MPIPLVLLFMFYSNLIMLHSEEFILKSAGTNLKRGTEMRYHKDPQALIEDYEGMTFWLTVNPHHYFPESWKKNYSVWLALGLAIGVCAKDVGWYPWAGYKEYFVGLDVDLRKLPIWGDSGLTKFITSEVNFLRLPLPTIRFTPQGTWFGFYF